MGPLGKFFILIGANLAFSFITIGIFKLQFRFPIYIIPLHMGLLTLLTVFLMLILGITISIRRFRELRLAPYLIALPGAVGSTALFLLYFANAASNALWAYPFKPNLLGTVSRQFKSLGGALPFTFPWVCLLLGIACFVILFLHLRWSKVLFLGLEELFLPARSSSLVRTRSRVIKSIFLLSLSLILFAAFMLIFLDRKHEMLWKGEPFIEFITDWSFLTMDPHRYEIMEEDRDLLAQYPSRLEFYKRNVVIIVLDAVRADHMQIYGYERETTPFLAQLLREKRLLKVSFALANCPYSSAGVLSTFSSRTFRHLSKYNLKIYDLLGKIGYQTYFVLSGDHTHYENMKFYLNPGEAYFFDGNQSGKFGMNDDRLIFEGLDRVPDYAGIPAFFYFHLMSPHNVGDKLEAYHRYKPSSPEKDFRSFFGWRGPIDQVQYINRFDNGVLQADSFVRELFSSLERKGYLQNSIVVILADHGEGLGERGRYGHGLNLYQSQIRIPILIYDEQDIPYANLEFASQIDVAPTILDRLGLPIPATWQGKSLLQSSYDRYSRHDARQHESCSAIVYRSDEGIYKYIRWLAPSTAAVEREELYELVSDPDDRHNLMDTADALLINHLRARMNESP